MRIDELTGNDKRTSSPWEIYEEYKNAAQTGLNAGQGKSLSAGGTQETAETKSVNNANGCETCKERKYQDGSNDPGVSYKTASHIAPEQAASVVKSHEMEHVSNNQAKAKRENKEIVSQTVTLHNGVCPECGKIYVSGGTTRTVSRSGDTPDRAYDQAGQNSADKGFHAYA